VWRPIPDSRFYSRNGAGVYERLTDQLFLRVDEVDEEEALEVCRRFAAAFEKESRSDGSSVSQNPDAGEGPVDLSEADAVELLDSIERRLTIEETLTQQLLARYGLAA
jgi:hypothetical protein